MFKVINHYGEYLTLSPSGWMWLNNSTNAYLFETAESAEYHMCKYRGYQIIEA